jgi:hypothetical protein
MNHLIQSSMTFEMFTALNQDGLIVFEIVDYDPVRNFFPNCFRELDGMELHLMRTSAIYNDRVVLWFEFSFFCKA